MHESVAACSEPGIARLGTRSFSTRIIGTILALAERMDFFFVAVSAVLSPRITVALCVAFSALVIWKAPPGRYRIVLGSWSTFPLWSFLYFGFVKAISSSNLAFLGVAAQWLTANFIWVVVTGPLLLIWLNRRNSWAPRDRRDS